MPPNGFPLVVIEASDFRGKTSIAQALSEILGATQVKTPIPPVAEFRKFYDCCGDFNARFLYYISALILASNTIDRLLQTGPVVCDRYIHSTVIYHQILGVDVTMVDIEKLNLVVPTLTVCLTCNSDVLAERIRLRNEKKKDHIEDRPGLLDDVDALMRSAISTHVDTSLTTPSEAAQLIAAML
jgi:thymidylate kinase